MVKHCNDNVSVILIKIAIWIERILIPIILAMGFPGNFMLFRTMQNSLCRSMHMSVFFKAIAVVDSAVLFILFGRWLESLHLFSMNELTDCGWSWGAGFAAHTISNWLLFILNFDRALFVIHNDLSLRYFNKRNCKIMCAVVSLVTIALMLHWPYILHYNRTSYQFSGTPCAFNKNAVKWGRVGWPILYNSLCIGLPYIGILFCLFHLIMHVQRSRRKVGTGLRQNERHGFRSTIAISLFYICCNTPYGIFQNFIGIILRTSSCHAQCAWIIVNILATLIATLNHAIKFYLLASQTKFILTTVRSKKLHTVPNGGSKLCNNIEYFANISYPRKEAYAWPDLIEMSCDERKFSSTAKSFRISL
ncbi:hypothetical protein GJ496_005805 [Pomphorhynchus laevis]|nr:hypothetical protein GJ496_005805 [Pomphorhynchus laevis]